MSRFPRIDARDPRPIYQQIVDSFGQALTAGRLVAGDQLPSVRELAVDLRVNPNTVHHAYRELEREGLIEVRRGQGTFIAHDASAAVHPSVRRELASAAARAAAGAGLSVHDLIAELEALTGTVRRGRLPRRGAA
ncbi:MAG: GntR family transcriptional regulator [Gemmatimonadota bacterium]